MRSLGELESAVMEELWEIGAPARVRDIQAQLAWTKALAYTTVMTVLDHLYRKGWARRKLVGRAYRYEPALSRADAAVATLRDVLEESGNPRLALLHFARTATDDEAAVLRAGLPNERPQ